MEGFPETGNDRLDTAWQIQGWQLLDLAKKMIRGKKMINFNDSKKKRIFAGVIVIILVGTMVLSLVVSAFV